jgi:hypothetical protein
MDIDIKNRDFIKKLEADKLGAEWALKDYVKEFHFDNQFYNWDIFWSALNTAKIRYI